MPNEQDHFLKDLEPNHEADPFAPTSEEPQVAKPEDPEEEEDEDATEMKARNRRERRLEAKLQAEREAGIQMAERLKVLAEVNSPAQSNDYLEAVKRIYGTDSPEATAATDILVQSLKTVEERATENALARLRQEQAETQAAVQQEERRLDSMLEEIEDVHNVDLTSSGSESTRRAFFQLLEKMSPKDAEGNVIEYADHHAVWEVLESRRQKRADTTAKDLSSRSMAQSNASSTNTIQDDATIKFLKENGII